MIELNEDLYIGEGAERRAFYHPQDNSRLIKVEYNNIIDRNQNDLDIYYYEYLKKENISYEHIPRCYGRLETNMGSAVVFDVIKDYNGSLSKTFENIVTENLLPIDEQNILLQELKQYLEDNSILFGDVVLSNILCQEISSHNYKLMIVDGLGARRFGFKLWLHIHSKLFTKYRINKQWKKLLKNYNSLAS